MKITLKNISTAFAILISCATLSAKDQKYYGNSYVYGSGSSKGEALSKSLTCLPYGAVIKKVNFNGTTSTKAGKVTDSNYRCQVIYISGLSENP